MHAWPAQRGKCCYSRCHQIPSRRQWNTCSILLKIAGHNTEVNRPLSFIPDEAVKYLLLWRIYVLPYSLSFLVCVLSMKRIYCFFFDLLWHFRRHIGQYFSIVSGITITVALWKQTHKDSLGLSKMNSDLPCCFFPRCADWFCSILFPQCPPIPIVAILMSW